MMRLVRGSSDAFLFVRIVCFATLVPALMRLRLGAVERILSPRDVVTSYDARKTETIVQMTDAAIRIGRPLVRRSCLVRGTTLYYFLSRAGLDVALSFGIGEVDGAFTGHCWLIRDGQPFLENHDPRPRFTVIFSIPNDDTNRIDLDRARRIAS